MDLKIIEKEVIDLKISFFIKEYGDIKFIIIGTNRKDQIQNCIYSNKRFIFCKN